MEQSTLKQDHHYRATHAFHSRLQSLESLFADVYSKVSQLEQEIAKHKELNNPTSPNIWDNFS